jgi:hypothetical protein
MEPTTSSRATQPALRAEHDTQARVHHPDAGLQRRLRRGLPLPANPGQKIRAGGALLGQDLVAAVPVVADGRGRDHDLRRIGEGGYTLRQKPRSLYPAVEDAPFLLGVPSSLGDALAGEVDDGLHPFEFAVDGAGGGVPADGVGPRLGAAQAGDGVAVGFQLRDER